MQHPNLAIAIRLHQSGDNIAAKEIYTQILATDPNNASVLHLLGILAAQENNFSLANQYLARALKIEPHSPTLHNSMGNILKNCGELNNALHHFNLALQQQPDNAVLYNNIAIVWQKLGQDKDAIKNYRRAIQLQPDYADAHYNLGLALMDNNALKEAISHLETAIEIQPQHSHALCQLAQAYQRQKQDDEALKLYQKSLKLDKNNIIAQHNLGTLLLTKNKFAAAIRHFKKVINIDSHHYDAFYNLGVAFLRTKNPEAALKYFLHLAQTEKNFDVYYNLGVIYNDINRTSDAITYFNEALKLNDNDFATQVNLGAIYLKQENYDKALNHYTKAARIQPQNKEISYILTAIKQDKTPIAAPSEYVQNLFDNYANNYDKHLEMLEYKGPQFICEAIINVAHPPAHVWDILDLGCGTGLCGEKIHIFAHKLFGIDMSDAMLKIAAQKNIYDKLQKGDIETTLINYHDIDLIVAADTFPYIGNLANIFSLCKKILKKSAFFAFTVEKLNVSNDKTNSQEYILQRSLRFAHSEEYIVKLAQKSTFKILEQIPINIRKHRNIAIESLLYILQS